MNLIQLAEEVILEAGEILKKGFGTSFQIQSKGERHNLVTEYDRAAQKFILERIKKTFPSHSFLAEEDNIKSAPSETILWIVDPLDGTVNFAHEIPFYGISIAAAKGSEILCAAVYCPTLEELFLAEKGSGAYLGKKKLFVTAQTNLEDSLLGTGFPYNVSENPLHCIDRFAKMISRGIPVRRLGVASLDICYVAAGRFDVFWEVGLHPWDIAGGKLILEESGGKMTHYDGSAHQIFSYATCLATNGHLHQKMVSLLKEDLP